MMNDKGKRMNKEAAADYLGISPRKLHELSIEIKQIPYYKLDPKKRNSPVRFYERDLEEWEESRRISA